MCTYATVHATLEGSAKGPESKWFRLTDGTVYFDHPVHAMAGHTVNIDLRNPAQGPAARVALELHADAARDLANAILRSLDAVPEAVLAAG